MGKRKLVRAQMDFFSQDPDRMQWVEVPQTVRQDTQVLLAQLILSVITPNQELQTQESHHAIEDHR